MRGVYRDGDFDQQFNYLNSAQDKSCSLGKRGLRRKLPAYASEVHFFEMLHKTLSHSEKSI